MLAIKSPSTREKGFFNYIGLPEKLRLKRFFNYIGLPGSVEEQAHEFVQKDYPRLSKIQSLLFALKIKVDKKEIVSSTIWNYIAAIKLFCEMNYIDDIKWKRLTRGLSRGRKWSDDRAPTTEEIKRLCEYPDRRVPGLIYSMESGGWRLGAWNYMKWGHIIPVTEDGVAKVRVYAGEEEEYFTFITPEAYKALKGWMEFRKMCGENVTEDSWVMRTLWDVNAGVIGATRPRQLKTYSIKTLIQNAMKARGLRAGLKPGKRRYEFKALHGFRKYFKTRAEQVMRPINVEVLMGHTTGISDSYYRPSEKELLDDYLKAVPLLTINEPTTAVQESVNEDRFLKLVQTLIDRGQLDANWLKRN